MDAVVTPKRLNHVRITDKKLIWIVPCGLLIASAACLIIDTQVAAFFADEASRKAINGPVRESLEICESFGHGFGATLIIIAVAVLDPWKWRLVPWLFASSLGAGLMANAIKHFVARTRPSHFQFTDRTVWETFAATAQRGMGMQSFPSAHTATAVGLAVILGTLYPRGRYYFFVLAALVGLQRIVSSAHFPSDVMAGAAVGWIVGTGCSIAVLKRQSSTIES